MSEIGVDDVFGDGLGADGVEMGFIGGVCEVSDDGFVALYKHCQ